MSMSSVKPIKPNTRPCQQPCAFCEIDPQRIIYEGQHCFAVRDLFPVSEGHSLIISKRHIGSFFETSAEEQAALIKAMGRVKADIDKQFSPETYNVGINDGPEAGQTIPHLHIHLIPRYKGDVDEPQGGVRGVIPGKAAY